MSEQFLTLMADLDDDSQAIMSKWYKSLTDVGFVGAQTPQLPFHISLASFSPDAEQEAVAVMKKAAAEFQPVPVSISHIGLFAEGRVLFGAPDLSSELTALHKACAKTGTIVNNAWVPHATVLIDEPETICSALPVFLKSFRPFTGKITRLHLCAFWPTREIAAFELNGDGYKPR